MRLWCAGLVVLAACGRSEPPAAPIHNARPVPPPHVEAVCPDSVLLEYWRTELFPGCPPAPFWRVGAVCDHGCPKPCGATIFDRAVGHPVAMAFDYDANGRWTRTTVGWDVGRFIGTGLYAQERPTSRATYCTRDDAHRGHCARQDERRGGERIDVEVTYDDEDDVTAIVEDGDRERGTRFEYLPGHRVSVERSGAPGGSERRFDYTYDERGWLVRIASSGWGFSDVRTYAHDGAGRLATITTQYDQRTSVQRFEYDARGRLAKMIEDETEATLPPRHEENTYRYECAAPRPLEEAIAATAALSTRACACADAACKQRVRGDYDTFRYGLDGVRYADGTAREQYERLEKQLAALDACLQ